MNDYTDAIINMLKSFSSQSRRMDTLSERIDLVNKKNEYLVDYIVVLEHRIKELEDGRK